MHSVVQHTQKHTTTCMETTLSKSQQVQPPQQRERHRRCRRGERGMERGSDDEKEKKGQRVKKNMCKQ